MLVPNSTLSDYMITIFQDRHSGMDSHQAILPDALRVNANLFQTDLCRNPGYKDVFELAIHGTGYPLPGGYDDTCAFVYNDESEAPGGSFR